MAIGNFTDSRNYIEATCVVTPREHAGLTKESCVYYDGCRIVTIDFLEGKKEANLIVMGAPFDRELLHRIQRSVCRSERTPYDVRQLLLSQGLGPEG